MSRNWLPFERSPLESRLDHLSRGLMIILLLLHPTWSLPEGISTLFKLSGHSSGLHECSGAHFDMDDCQMFGPVADTYSQGARVGTQ